MALYLSEAIRKNNFLESLDISYCGFSKQAMEFITESVVNSKISDIDFSRNEISIVAIKLLSSAIKGNKSDYLICEKKSKSGHLVCEDSDVKNLLKSNKKCRN